jgi:hypothetical protein
MTCPTTIAAIAFLEARSSSARRLVADEFTTHLVLEFLCRVKAHSFARRTIAPCVGTQTEDLKR